MYPECNAHVPFCHLWPVRFYSIFRPLSNGTIFEKKNIAFGHEMCFLTLQLLSERVFILRRSERNMIQNVYWSSCKVPLFFSDFNET